MRFQVVRQGIEGLFHERVIGDAAPGAKTKALKESVSEAVGGEDAVQVASHHPAVEGTCSLVAAVFPRALQPQPRVRQPRPGGLADVHFIARDGLAGLDIDADPFAQ